MSNLRPRLCVLNRAGGDYGFHLHTDRGKSGQFIRLVEPDTPAFASGLRAGDRLMFVNGENVEEENHQQVVARIKSTTGALELIVVDEETAALLNKHNLRCQKEFVTDGIPLRARDSVSDAESNGSPGEASPLPRENGDTTSEGSRKGSVSSCAEQDGGGLRPRLCHMQKGDNGYGFNLHSKKSGPGQFIRAVDEDSPAARAGLKVQDKIVQVNGVPVLGMQYSEVVEAIRAGGDETKLLVVDLETEEFFNRCNVQPSEYHLTGPLPVLVSQRLEEEDEITVERVAKKSLSSSASSASSEGPATTFTPPEQAQKSDGEAEDIGMGMSLAQAKERAHQKRAAKKAPQMDWRKRNELFSSL